MNTDTMNPQDTNPTDTDPTAPAQNGTDPTAPAQIGTALRRPFEGRVLTGVAEGLARYFGVDTTLVRIGFVVLTVIGGAGVPLYLAGLLLIPDEGSDQSIAASIIESFQNRNR